MIFIFTLFAAIKRSVKKPSIVTNCGIQFNGATCSTGYYCSNNGKCGKSAAFRNNCQFAYTPMGMCKTDKRQAYGVYHDGLDPLKCPDMYSCSQLQQVGADWIGTCNYGIQKGCIAALSGVGSCFS
eukprot:NODE_707_length_4569_cov_0.134228.p3 type:complete len:126 gc:universal NODE_707_length_4569_cov_0.134228:4061-4438(+)